MSRLWILGGTTEGRALLALGLPCVYTVATEYGAELASGNPHAEVRAGRLDGDAMRRLLRETPIACVLDATHPYAVEVSRNACAAAQNAGVRYVRVLRAETSMEEETTVRDLSEAARYLTGREGAILLTTGSKELEPFLVPELLSRIHVRVLPDPDVLARLETLGIPSDHVFAMQGPFSREANAAHLRQAGARYLVTKDGGPEGGMQEKLNAAREAGVEVVRIARPQEEGLPLHEVELLALQLMAEKHAQRQNPLEGTPMQREGVNIPRFPLWVDLRGKRVIVVGGGVVARRRIDTLRRCGAEVTVICPDPPGIPGIHHLPKKYAAGDLAEAFLAVAATDDADVNAAIVEEAFVRSIPVSTADSRNAGSFHFPSLVNEGEVAVSVSSGGSDPKLTRQLGDRLRKVWKPWVEAERRHT